MDTTLIEPFDTDSLKLAGEEETLQQLEKFRQKGDDALNAHLLETLLNQTYLDFMNIQTAYRLIGHDNLTALLNSKLKNSKFSVDLVNVGHGEPIIMCEYVGFSLQVQELIIPKYTHDSTTEEALNSRLGCAGRDKETSRTISYQILLSETSEADTFGQIVRGINFHLGPFVEKQMKSLRLADYRMVFQVGLTF